MNIRFCKILVCLALGFGSVVGMVMRPEEIEELMSNMNQPKVTTTIPDENEKDDPIKKFLRRNCKSD